MPNSSFNINPIYQAKEKKLYEASYYLDGILKKDRYILAEAITIVESKDPIKKKLAKEIIALIPRHNQSIRLAITGPPGVGKSTFIEHFGAFLSDQNQSIAVLAIDPSSHEFKGSVLGDKTRMASLLLLPNVFIRPTSAGGLLGGVSHGTKNAILLCEAAGYKYIFIETVGVGQSEYWAAHISDFTLYLLQPGGGDDIQGIKRGILELADLIIVNKSDGGQEELARQTALTYKSVIGLFQPKIIGIDRSVVNISSLHHLGFESLIEQINRIYAHCISENLFTKIRSKQEVFWFDAMVKEELYDTFASSPTSATFVTELRRGLDEQKFDASSALNQISLYFQHFIKNDK